MKAILFLFILAFTGCKLKMMPGKGSKRKPIFKILNYENEINCMKEFESIPRLKRSRDGDLPEGESHRPRKRVKRRKTIVKRRKNKVERKKQINRNLLRQPEIMQEEIKGSHDAKDEPPARMRADEIGILAPLVKPRFSQMLSPASNPAETTPPALHYKPPPPDNMPDQYRNIPPTAPARKHFHRSNTPVHSTGRFEQVLKTTNFVNGFFGEFGYNKDRIRYSDGCCVKAKEYTAVAMKLKRLMLIVTDMEKSGLPHGTATNVERIIKTTFDLAEVCIYDIYRDQDLHQDLFEFRTYKTVSNAQNAFKVLPYSLIQRYGGAISDLVINSEYEPAGRKFAKFLKRMYNLAFEDYDEI